MAVPFDSGSLAAAPVAKYADIRNQLASGDLIFCSGNYAFSKAIRCITDSCWSHVGIVFRFGAVDRVLLLESVETVGVRFAPLSKYLENYENGRPYDGPIAVARVDGLDADHVTRLAGEGFDLLTRPWGWIIAGYILLRLVFNRVRRPHARSYLCSELVARCFDKAGIVFHAGTKRYVSPGDIWRDARVKFLFRIH